MALSPQVGGEVNDPLGIVLLLILMRVGREKTETDETPQKARTPPVSVRSKAVWSARGRPARVGLGRPNVLELNEFRKWAIQGSNLWGRSMRG